MSRRRAAPRHIWSKGNGQQPHKDTGYLTYRGGGSGVQLELSVTHRDGTLISSIVIDGCMPAVPRAGDIVNIGDLEGFPEARQTRGVVRKVHHRFTGSPLSFRQVVSVEIDETAD